MRRPLVLLYGLILSAAAPAAPLSIQHCVDTSAELEAALADVASKSVAFEVNAEIRIATGGYSIDPPLQSMIVDALALKGGYGGAACSTRSYDAADTFIAISTPVSFRHAGTFEVEGITFSTSVSGFNVFSEGPVTTRLVNNRFLHAGPASDYAVLVGRHSTPGNESATQLVTIAGNVVDAPASVCQMKVSNGNPHPSVTVGPGTAHVVNNTFVHGTDRGLCFERMSDAFVYNNIIADAPDGSVVDLVAADTTPATLRNNLVQTPIQLPEVLENWSTIVASPVFDASGDLRPAAQSPAVNSGWPGGVGYALETEAAPGTPSVPLDLTGEDRVIGSSIDRGAVESLFDDLTSTITVTSNSDDPAVAGTLRKAIELANATQDTPQRIVFELGQGPNDCGPAKAIQLLSPLPEITDDLEIDGYGGLAVPNAADVGFDASLCVVLMDKIGDGVTVDKGFVVPAFASDVTLKVKGVAFHVFNSAAIALFGGSEHVIQGNAFGVGFAGVGRGITIGSPVSQVLVGGYARAERNHLGGATTAALQVLGSDNDIVGNLIGPGRSGSFDAFAQNARGVELVGSNNNVFGNTISGNLSDAVLVQGNANFLHSNLIGYNDGMFCTPQPCSPAQGNLRGVRILGDNNRLVANRIGHSTQQGVTVATNATGNQIANRNLIADNGTLGIDLRSDNVADDPQIPDVDEAVSVANGGQNFPTITAASGPPKAAGPGISATGAVSGDLHSRNGTYQIELFASPACDANGHGEGAEWIGSTAITITNATKAMGQIPALDGSGSFSAPVTSPTELIGRAITATARAGNGDTSEFSTCFTFSPANTAPSFQNVELIIPASTPAGTSIALLHSTDDGLPVNPGQVTFTLLTAMVPFTLSAGGELTVTQADIFANAPIYVLDVKVSDGEKSTTGIVTIRSTHLFRDGFEDLTP